MGSNVPLGKVGSSYKHRRAVLLIAKKKDETLVVINDIANARFAAVLFKTALSRFQVFYAFHASGL